MENAKLFYAFGYVQINIADLAKGAFAGLATSAAFFFFSSRGLLEFVDKVSKRRFTTLNLMPALQARLSTFTRRLN